MLEELVARADEEKVKHMCANLLERFFGRVRVVGSGSSDGYTAGGEGVVGLQLQSYTAPTYRCRRWKMMAVAKTTRRTRMGA